MCLHAEQAGPEVNECGEWKWNCQYQTQLACGNWAPGRCMTLSCLTPTLDSRSQAIHLDMQLGEHTTDYAEFAAKDKLTLLHLRVQQLVEQVVQIQKEQEYQRVRGRAGPVGTGDV